jgi:hypothetical protein
VGQSPDQLRREIESLRGDLSTLVEAVGERVSPKQVVRRSANSVGSTMRSVTDSVMGSAEEASDTLRTRARQVSRQAQSHASGARSGSRSSSRRSGRPSPGGRGNRAAVGLVALGAGMLAASLLPPSQAEADAVEELKQSAARFGQEMKATGRSVAADLQPELDKSKNALSARTRRSSDRVTRSASASTRRVQQQARSGAARTRAQAR